MFCMEINELLLKCLKHQRERQQEGANHEDILIDLPKGGLIPCLWVGHLHSVVVQSHR